MAAEDAEAAKTKRASKAAEYNPFQEEAQAADEERAANRTTAADVARAAIEKEERRNKKPKKRRGENSIGLMWLRKKRGQQIQ